MCQAENAVGFASATIEINVIGTCMCSGKVTNSLTY